MTRQKSKPDAVYSTKKKKPAEAPVLDPAVAFDYIAADLRPLAVAIDNIAIDPKNCNKHPEGSIEAIMGSLQTYGQRKPIVVNKTSGHIEAGNGTVEAARALGWAHIAAIFVEDDPKTATGYSICDNQTARLSFFDKEKLKVSLKEISTKNDERLDRMIGDMAKSLKLYPTDDPTPDDKKDVNFQAGSGALELIVTCDDDDQRDELLTRLRKEGWQVRKAA